MGCRNRGFSEDESAVSDSISDALLLTTVCIIGLPVDVHIKDGSIYSGIFHTACVEHDYAIVLKRASLTKKGNCDANVANGGVIETLVVLSENLVQMVAKSVLLPAEGFTRKETGDVTGAVAGTLPSSQSPESEAKTRVSMKNVDQLHIAQKRCLSGTENGSAVCFTPQRTSDLGNTLEVENWNSNGIGSMKKEEAFNVAVVRREVGNDGPRREQRSNGEMSKFEDKQSAHEIQGSSSSLDARDCQLSAVNNGHANTSREPANGVLCDDPAPSIIAKLDHQCHNRGTSAEDLSSHDAISSGTSTAASSVVAVASDPCLSSTSTPTGMLPPKSSSSNRITKEFKLNPGAKIFSPSLAHQRSATPPAVLTVASPPYIPDNYPVVPVAAQPEVEISPFAPRSSLPLKFVPYGNLLAGNGGNEVQHSPSIIGHMTNRTQPIRYGTQYHPVQAGPTYVHPSSQNVMVGRVGQLVYVHPVSQDVVQGTTGFSQVSTLLTPHQVHLPKHQGTAAAQALQLCMTPPFLGQPPYVMPSHIPISQPPFPVICPISVPGSNGFLASKFS